MNDVARASAAHRAAGSSGILRWGRIAVLAFALWPLTHQIDEPFSGWFEWNSAYFGYFARNHLDYGWDYTKGYCTYGETAEAPEPPRHYINHPPLACAVAAPALRVFGSHEWVPRAVAIAFTLGSAWILMTIVARLHSLMAALLAGFFFVALPITAYFGKMLDHVPLMQFFSLWMLHGFLQWRGFYGDGHSRERGAGAFATATVLGIASGWAVAIMSGWLWLWLVFDAWRERASGGAKPTPHEVERTSDQVERASDQVERTPSEAGRRVTPAALALVTLTPALALIAVVYHIAAAVDFDGAFFRELFLTRSVGLRPEGEQPWSAWLAIQWDYLRLNFSLLGVLLGGLMPCLHFALKFRSEAPSRALAVAASLIGLQGVAYVVIFKNQSWTHEYWQVLLAPYVALAMAYAVVVLYRRAEALRTGAGIVTASLVTALALPGLYMGWSEYVSREHVPREYLEVYRVLAERIPAKAPVMTYRDWGIFSSELGGQRRKWIQPQVVWHADRPLTFARDLAAVEAGAGEYAAYVLELTNEEDARQLRDFLVQRYRTFRLGERQLVALLREPLESAPGL